MINGKKVVFYELNEVPRKVLVDYTQTNPRSALAQIYRHSAFYETVTADKGHLSPWITWPTLHRGVTNEKHLIQNFGQDLAEVNQEYPAYTELLARHGVKVGVFGSLHTYPLPADVSRYAFYVPDTFANGSECFPDDLTCFQDFNLKMVDSSGRNVSKGLNIKAALPFVAKAPQLGVGADTVYRLAKQIISEKIVPSRIVRRRTSQMQLAFDLFMKQLQQHKPDLSTFFTNHVASSMHRYWPAKYPSDFQDLELTPEWHTSYQGEIDFTMAEADRTPVEFIDLGNNIFQIFFQVENSDVANLTVTLNGETKSLKEMGMGITAIEDESGSYAYHIPEGILLVFDPERLAAKDCGTISTTQIAPAMLNNFQIAPPAYMVA